MMISPQRTQSSAKETVSVAQGNSTESRWISNASLPLNKTPLRYPTSYVPGRMPKCRERMDAQERPVKEGF
ncbi:hypothetical protein MMIC_P1199 [Mariprofundus micogutta]|uniref:Uncharacterized protein n=1 Tax=Mariprofundus micogutta TaxID=1921010 RepID=A0A1L8CMT6_9PROT|nr:hypothetical protein MMIC_P1199 [Mariprofundus micogutta]